MPLFIGLTGGIASGKTTVSDAFQQQFNIDVIDADVIARQVVEPQTEGLAQIVAHFGKEILQPNGALDRRKLREHIFNDEHQRLWLNQLLHPLIRLEIEQQMRHTSSDYVLIVIPLLIESDLQALIDRVLVVDVTLENQIKRVMQRDHISAEQAEKIIKTQSSRQERLRSANDIIDNNSDEDNLIRQVSLLHHQYQKYANTVG